MNELEKELSKIVGLKQLKTQLHTWAKGLVMDEKRRQLGIKINAKKPPHMAFLGNPGVGKTSMARILGNLLKKFGILPSNRLVEVQRTDLVGQYIGHTGIKTKAKIQEAEGGVLFVDEAYRLMVPGSKIDFGKEALEEIMHAMDAGKLSIIFAGYVEPMKLVFDSNEGFRRRITTHFVFEDFTCEELAQILHLKIPKQQGPDSGSKNVDGLYHGCTLSHECSISAIAELIERETSNEQRSKMNGGLIDQVLTKAKESLDLRLDVDCVDIHKLTTITLEDLKTSLCLLKTNNILMDGFKEEKLQVVGDVNRQPMSTATTPDMPDTPDMPSAQRRREYFLRAIGTATSRGRGKASCSRGVHQDSSKIGQTQAKRVAQRKVIKGTKKQRMT
ncbi:DNA helicase [Lithospermum erythrorhizon]|uniref:DNA helicase n=1 Tax=Lithospermum erythrorhizon TaxID=34254 RepID=A0AAV3Q1Y2_LITER